MKIKHFIVLFMVFVFSTACAPTYYESVFRDEGQISSKDQLRLGAFIENRDWDSAYKLVNTYAQVKHTFHDIGRTKDAVRIYDRCAQGKKINLFACLDSVVTR